MKEYDIAIVGGGKAGYTATLRAAEMGARTVLIEKYRLGGNWIFNGLFPFRYLLKSIGRIQWMDYGASEKAGFEDGKLTNIPRLLGHLREISESFSQNWKMVLENKNIDLIQGTGKSVTSNSILVETAGGEESVFASKVIIATGSVNKEISALPFDGKRLVSGDSLLDFDDLPRQILIVGGQAQGCELATLLSRIGC